MISSTTPNTSWIEKRLLFPKQSPAQPIAPRRLIICVLLLLVIAVILACRFPFSQATSTPLYPPTPGPTPTIKVNLPKQSVFPSSDGRELGDMNAPVTVEVFSDFQCPSCRKFATSVEPTIIMQYVASNQVHLIYRHFPFLGGESMQAARASMCAAEQDRFWEYHDVLFANWNGENKGAYKNDKLLAFASAINLDMDAFATCVNENRYQSIIDQDYALGKKIGVRAVPSVYVNGKIVTSGYIPAVKDMQKAIEEALGMAQ
jgi:protein-disulfide isomerase